MDAGTIIGLAERVADVVATAGGETLRVEMGEMADGSGRHYALVTVHACAMETEYRVTTPAPQDAPAWAARYDDWTVAGRFADGWLSLEHGLEPAESV